ncbi:MAG: DUF1820 family protein [Methylococcaceae bacterium]|nr:DUF1820 family protein [Methylococcaceae bacterium]
MPEKHIYKVVFVNQEQVYEVFVKNVYQGELYGFVIIEGFVFGEKSSIVVDPTEERLRIEFEGVNRSYIPVQRIIRIDQVKKRGLAKVLSLTKDGIESLNQTTSFYPNDK